MRKNKYIYRLLAICLIFSVLFSTPSAFASEIDSAIGKASDSIPPQMDLSLEDELAQVQTVLAQFSPNDPDGFYVFENPQKVASPYIPEGALCTEVCIIGHVVSIDYRIDNIRYIAQYCNDGTVRLTCSEWKRGGVADVYDVTSASDEIKHYDALKNRKTWSIADEKQNAQTSSEETDRGTTSVKIVSPLSYRDDPDTAPYKAKIVLSGTASLSSLQGTGYNTMQPFRVYETMWYHQQVTRMVKPFDIYSSLQTIASAFSTRIPPVRAFLTTAEIAISAANLIQEACEVIESDMYTFLGGKESAIFDPTMHNAYVEAYSIWGEGTIVMSWNYSSSAGYDLPNWGHYIRSDALKVANLTINERGKSAYNTCVNIHGVWGYGIGNGFGY